MTVDFPEILRQHAKAYPLMQAQDYYKLAYQSEYGPAHLIEDESFTDHLIKEWNISAGEYSCRQYEMIGNGLCRFHLTKQWPANEAGSLLAKLVTLTSSKHFGTLDGLRHRLLQLETLQISGMREYLRECERNGYPAVHHSDVFRIRYRPHYRVLRSEYAHFFPLLVEIQRLCRQETPVIVAIDGNCGSGKTGLAAMLQSVFPCNVLHMDDHYLSFPQRQSNWEQMPGGNIDFQRIREELLQPVREGKPIDYQPFDCGTGQLSVRQRLSPQRLTILEGTYSQHPLLREYHDLTVFLHCSKQVQMSRLEDREGVGIRGFEKLWIPMEERYFDTCRPQNDSKFIFDTSNLF